MRAWLEPKLLVRSLGFGLLSRSFGLLCSPAELGIWILATELTFVARVTALIINRLRLLFLLLFLLRLLLMRGSHIFLKLFLYVLHRVLCEVGHFEWSCFWNGFTIRNRFSNIPAIFGHHWSWNIVLFFERRSRRVDYTIFLLTAFLSFLSIAVWFLRLRKSFVFLFSGKIKPSVFSVVHCHCISKTFSNAHAASFLGKVDGWESSSALLIQVMSKGANGKLALLAVSMELGVDFLLYPEIPVLILLNFTSLF